MKDINSPQHNDNRNYDYENCFEEDRWEYQLFVKLIPQGSSVLDLGCGNGSLLKRLEIEKLTKGKGIELSQSGVDACVKKGLDVAAGRIDEPLPFPDKHFDYAICNVTIQMVMFPEVLVREMKRVSQYQIICFPNFGFFKNRIDLLFRGRMPRPMLFTYRWYSTGHIHQLSFRDFKELLNDIGGMKIKETFYSESPSKLKSLIQSLNPNLFHILGIFLIESE